MKIILVATDSRGKNLVFVTDTLRAYSLPEAVDLAKQGKLENIYPVHHDTGVYLRTKRGLPKKEQLDSISVSSYRIFSAPDDLHHAFSTQAFGTYWPLYKHALEEDGGTYIVIGDHALITMERARKKLQPHRDLIFAAAERFDVDPHLLGAIVIDEIARFAPWQIVTDPLGGHFLGANTSVGIAQVKIDTALGLIKKGYYNPNPRDSRLSPKNIQKITRQELYPYLKKPEHGIFFAAARMRDLIDEWKKFVDLNQRPEIIATLYHLPHRPPRTQPESNDRGLQIADEFYKLAKQWLR
ncbi:MAG: hypothetical protein A3J10_01245 [Candidatus Sungbacteria bacterium RIFCSPLOWO2_02_FULL_54_10]|uniref:Uncharacterized protein n=2 Tax=Candidatus Sungiibacteriota TaxID=1817917 RepID=A0A1G2L8W5_9BACT|nr:MAG: hypothetical protein A3C92_00430 [Candidatus Sungbacteria bacterium RIFCSPHIGHO2_02_FULL_53_17]OHA08086.1 MAG: hypothetical protein A3B34_01785 [Candidatus Sungbacteria bacterium RIFCSPLOWO2_01_FULL_54_21]OHA13747.1 MAG: hypothetical protein A3J10_01245 [Candidatus Sungbacteria bacterium RIFCSPLOWO2_02_FULL_54_10]